MTVGKLCCLGIYFCFRDLFFLFVALKAFVKYGFTNVWYLILAFDFCNWFTILLSCLKASYLDLLRFTWIFLFLTNTFGATSTNFNLLTKPLLLRILLSEERGRFELDLMSSSNVLGRDFSCDAGSYGREHNLSFTMGQ